MKAMKYTKADLLDTLHAGYATVTFTKVDGTERVMECTLRADLLPLTESDDTKKTKKIKENEDVIRVFDTEKKGWRSFRIDSVKSVHSLE